MSVPLPPKRLLRNIDFEGLVPTFGDGIAPKSPVFRVFVTVPARRCRTGIDFLRLSASFPKGPLERGIDLPGLLWTDSISFRYTFSPDLIVIARQYGMHIREAETLAALCDGGRVFIGLTAGQSKPYLDFTFGFMVFSVLLPQKATRHYLTW